MSTTEELVHYLNDKYTINGAFYWRDTTFFVKLIPSSQRDVTELSALPAHLRFLPLCDFGIGFVERSVEGYVFELFQHDLSNYYEDKAEYIRFTGTTIDEVMNAVVAYIIVNGMCDLRHKALTAP